MVFGVGDVRHEHLLVEEHAAPRSQKLPSTWCAGPHDALARLLRPFLAKRGHSAEDVERMHAAWVKSCLLQVTLWSHAYVKDGDF
jgi:hypothetical protein